MSATTVFVVTGVSESTDHYGPFVYKKKPSDKVLEALVKMLDYGEGDGPGDYGSYVHLSVDRCKVN